MAEDNKTVTPDGAEHAQEPENLTEKSPAPDVSASTAPEMADGDVVVPSNVIDGLFEEKRAAAQEAEKQAAEQDKAGQEAPDAREDAPGRGGRPPKADKSDKPKKVERTPRLPKGPKEEKQAGGAVVGGASGKSARERRSRAHSTRTAPAAEGRDPPRRNGANRIYRSR